MMIENKMNKDSNNKGSNSQKLAMILADLAYHVSPEIVKYIVNRNNNDYAYFRKLFEGKIEIKHWLFEGSGSDCVFPGVKRYISMKGSKQEYNSEYKAIIDDNILPRYIWCYLMNGKGYSGSNWKKSGLHEFELAHIFAHKESELSEEKQYFKKVDDGLCPYAEFTSAANIILLPKGTVRPTDNSPILKSIFYKRYMDLYGETVLNGRKGFKYSLVPEWYSELSWNNPFLPDDWKSKIDKLLEYRVKRITDILSKF